MPAGQQGANTPTGAPGNNTPTGQPGLTQVATLCYPTGFPQFPIECTIGSAADEVVCAPGTAGLGCPKWEAASDTMLCAKSLPGQPTDKSTCKPVKCETKLRSPGDPNSRFTDCTPVGQPSSTAAAASAGNIPLGATSPPTGARASIIPLGAMPSPPVQLEGGCIRNLSTGVLLCPPGPAGVAPPPSIAIVSPVGGHSMPTPQSSGVPSGRSALQAPGHSATPPPYIHAAPVVERRPPRVSFARRGRHVNVVPGHSVKPRIAHSAPRMKPSAGHNRQRVAGQRKSCPPHCRRPRH